MSTIPPRPETPALDALWHKYGVGASRFYKLVPPGEGWDDAALNIYHVYLDIGKQLNGNPLDAADIAAIPKSEIDAAEQWQKDVTAAVAANNGFLPGEEPQHAEPVAVGAPVPNGTPDVLAIPKAPHIEAPAVTVPQEVHEHHARSWLSAIGSLITPDNVAAVAGLLSAYAAGKKKS